MGGGILGLNILIVDDSLTSRNIIKQVIGMLKLPVEQFYEAEEGVEGLNILDHHQVDFIFLDINMPGMDGIEMARRIKESENLSSIPIIFVSSSVRNAGLSEIMKLDGIYFIRKPFNPREIREIIINYEKGGTANDYHGLFFNSIKKVIEKTFFTLAKKIDNSDVLKVQFFTKNQIYYHINLEFTGDMQGRIEYFFPIDLSKQLVYSQSLGMSGLKYEEHLVEDNLKEFANITCGHFFSTYFPYKNYNIQFPKFQKVTFDSTKIINEIYKWEQVKIENQYFFYKLSL